MGRRMAKTMGIRDFVAFGIFVYLQISFIKDPSQ
jgi:hypothetical protein